MGKIFVFIDFTLHTFTFQSELVIVRNVLPLAPAAREKVLALWLDTLGRRL
tara:strand:- start:14 stop:166 length:153 start_codon:yes stop_codon:yes gene_type:complete